MAKRAMRWLGEGVFGLAIAAGVFTGLTGLVAGAARAPGDTIVVREVDFEFVPPEERLETTRDPKPEREVRELPPGHHFEQTGPCGDCRGAIARPRLEGVAFERGLQRIEIGAAGVDSDLTPLVRIPPEYPPNGRGNGSVLVRFDVSKAGTVENARVIESTPRGMFDKAALQAISRWRYRPAVMDGQTVERRGVQVRLRFELEEA